VRGRIATYKQKVRILYKIGAILVRRILHCEKKAGTLLGTSTYLDGDGCYWKKTQYVISYYWIDQPIGKEAHGMTKLAFSDLQQCAVQYSTHN
jgi:hypothetical protein